MAVHAIVHPELQHRHASAADGAAAGDVAALPEAFGTPRRQSDGQPSESEQAVHRAVRRSGVHGRELRSALEPRG